MDTLKVASWNIYFSHKLVTKNGNGWKIASKATKRANNVADIIDDIDADILGIVECMPEEKLRYFIDHYSLNYRMIVEGKKSKLNVGMLYRADKVAVKKIGIPKKSWSMRIGYGSKLRKYSFSHPPLLVEVKSKQSNKRFLLVVIHTKSKKTYTDKPSEPLDNRKKIIAQCLRIREILIKLSANNTYRGRFLVMGDINDGPGFDKYEAKLAVSGVEALAGNIFKPDEILYSFVDLSNGGISTTPFFGAPQLDHILYSQKMTRPKGPKIRKNSAKVRSDLVDFDSGSGKAKDSDHIPIEVKVTI